MKKEEIVEKINQAFKSEKLPYRNKNELESYDWERKQVLKFFNGKKRDELTLNDVKRYGKHLDHTALLSLLPLDYYKYYLPFFLKLGIEYCEKIDLLCDTILYSFVLKNNDGSVNKLTEERLHSLSKQQLKVLLKYLHYMKLNYSKIIDEWAVRNAEKSILKIIKAKNKQFI